MYFGEFEYRIDLKGRVPIPPKFRAELKERGVILTYAADKCINIYSLAEWKKLANSFISGPIAPSKLRRLNRATFASAFEVEIDGQGRITIPAVLKEHAGIEDDVVFAGVNTYLELWGKKQWIEEKTSSQEEAWHTTESLERR